jgi:hypothetical protein
MLKSFLKSKTDDVREHLAQNMTIPVSILQALTNDEAPEVQYEAKQTLAKIYSRNNPKNSDEN